MIKSIYGPITNPKTGKSKDILVKCKPNSLKDILIGGSLVAVGIAYLTVTAFKNGSNAFEIAEFNTLKDLDLFNDGKVG